MTNEAKAEILSRIHAADGPKLPEIPRNYRFHTDADVVEELAEALRDYTAEVTVCENEESVLDALKEALRGIDSCVLPPALPDRYSHIVREACAHVLVDCAPDSLSKEQLASIEGVVTGARCAISLSGTIILDGSGDQGRRILTLLPDVHIVILPESAIYSSVPEAVRLLGEHPERPTTWIAGPSASSDIELVRVDGVHGPRTLRVIIVKGY